MIKTANLNDELSKVAQLLQYLLAIELWRGGLSQKEIKDKLGISINAVNDMLKGVKRELAVKK